MAGAPQEGGRASPVCRHYMCVYIYVYVFMFVCMYIRIVCVCVCVCVCMFVCAYMFVCVCVYIDIYIHTYNLNAGAQASTATSMRNAQAIFAARSHPYARSSRPQRSPLFWTLSCPTPEGIHVTHTHTHSLTHKQIAVVSCSYIYIPQKQLVYIAVVYIAVRYICMYPEEAALLMLTNADDSTR